MIVVVIRYKTKATARRALTFIVRIFVNDTIAIAVWTSFHVCGGLHRRDNQSTNSQCDSRIKAAPGVSESIDHDCDEQGEFLVWGGSLQYSMPYLKARVQDSGLPNFVNRLVPITEFSFKTETSNFDENERTTGTVNPGLLYVADKYQLGVEAIIPINRATGDGVGVIGNLHLFVEDILPHSLGMPLFASAAEPHEH